MSQLVVIMTVRGVPIYWDGEVIEFTAGMTIDGDGGPHCYHPDGSPPGLDYLGNAGHPGNWWALATDNKKSSGNPIMQKSEDPAPGFYVSMTSLIRTEHPYESPLRYINSEDTPFVVIPGPLVSLVAPIFMGCHCEMVNTENGKTSDGVCADKGPSTHLGEGSMRLAKNLGIPNSPKSGGTDERIIHWRIYPGVPAVINGETFKLQPS